MAISACRGWQTYTRFESRSGQKAVIVEELPLGPDSSISVSYEDHGKRRILSRAKDDRVPRLAEVYWGKDENFFGVLVCDNITEPLIFGYDVESNTVLPADTIRAGLSRVLIARYNVSNDELESVKGNALEWACSDDGFQRFKSRHQTKTSFDAVQVDK